MKKSIILYSLISILLVSCLGHVPKGKEKKDLFGKWDGNTFINPYFDLQITLGENWKKEENKFQTVFGSTFIHADYYASEDTTYSLMTLNLECEKINPFDKGATVTKELNEATEAMRVLYDENEMHVEDLKPIQFGKRKYILCRTILLEGEGDSTFIDEYMSYEKDYFLSLSLSYRTVLDRKIGDEILKQLK